MTAGERLSLAAAFCALALAATVWHGHAQAIPAADITANLLPDALAAGLAWHWRRSGRFPLAARIVFSIVGIISLFMLAASPSLVAAFWSVFWLLLLPPLRPRQTSSPPAVAGPTGFDGSLKAILAIWTSWLRRR